MPSQIVGTPSAYVGRSAAKRSRRSAGARCGPGKIILIPIIAQTYGTPQQLAWNIGVAGSTLSFADRHQWSGWFAISVWITVERCE